MKLLHVTTVAIYFYVITIRVFEGKDCQSPQYFRMESPGVVKCSFNLDVFSVLWYDSSDFYRVDPVIILTSSVKSGNGFSSGKFDILPDGSLFIRNLSLEDEGTYTVVKVDTPTSRPITYTIEVFVLAQTFERAPVIERCGYNLEMCFQTVHPNFKISCTVKDARQSVPIRWMVRTVDGDIFLTSRLELTNGTNGHFTSRVTTLDNFAFSEILILLVCKAESPVGLLERNESLILLQNITESLMNAEAKQVIVPRDSKVKLPCTYINLTHFVWQVKKSPEAVFQPIIYAAFVGEMIARHISDGDYKLQQNSLVIDRIEVQDEGTYRCISGDGFQDNIILYHVVVFVYPEPPYVVVEGCNHQQFCVLEVKPNGILKCTLRRVHPQVNLNIAEVVQQSPGALLFYEKTLTTRENGDTFDIILTSKYRYNGVAGSRVPVKCMIVETNIDALQLSTTFELLFLHGSEPTTDKNMSSDGSIDWVKYVLLACVIFVLVNIGAVTGLRTVLGRREIIEKRGNDPEQRRMICLETKKGTDIHNEGRVGGEDEEQFIIKPEEEEPIMSMSHLQGNGKRERFIEELKSTYRDLYYTVQPIPYIRDRLYCVDKVFVEGDIEYLVAKEKIGGHGTWGKLTTYHEILSDVRVKSLRRIIEGEPGYGKSTLTLQLAYDWCNEVSLSYLKNVDILILLRLRQLRGVTSFYRAIKQFLLPKDSKFSESDIADIISDGSSVFVILDGYDEYPNQSNDVHSDVVSIIMRKMFQQFEVVTTTRSSYLPKKYPALTKRLKLKGFGDDARNQYIRKAVVCDEEAAAEKIKQRLKENTVLNDLCQVPLIFVMFAHMSHESKEFQKFNSATSFFRHMISCFHSHMKNKMEDENVEKFELFEKDHKALDDLAFEGLSSKSQRIVWDKRYASQKLGQEFYEQYVRIGILVEEEVLDICDDQNTLLHEPRPIRYKTEVRFYHKLFCEWYAAYHLSEYSSRDDVTFDPYEQSEVSERSDSDSLINTNNDELDSQHYLRYLDPFDLQYVYRFACGLRPDASDKIIEYLKTREGEGKFAILCLLEKNGNFEDVLEDVEDVCSQEVYINNDDTLLIQRSTIQLLEIATANEISISRVYLYNCFSTVNMPGASHLQLKSDFSIPILTTLKELTIKADGREIEIDELRSILQYSSNCLALKELALINCLLPSSVRAESVSLLISRSVEVIWRPHFTRYQLNMQSCTWEAMDNSASEINEMTDDDYQEEARRFLERWDHYVDATSP